MSVKVIILCIIGIFILGVINYYINKLVYKKSIVFKLISILTLPIVVCAVMGFCIGLFGISSILWAGPIALLAIAAGNYLVALNTQKPLEKMLSKIDLLSEGDVNVSFEKDLLKGNDEIARIYQRLDKLTRSLNHIATFAGNIGKGKLDSDYRLLGSKDILGQAMLDMRSSLVQSEQEKILRQVEDEKRNWVTVGLAKFAEILRQNNNDISELSFKIISGLIKYIKANQGGLFILNDDQPEHPVLELLACYAYERRKYLEKTLEINEGLVGTCFLERQTIYITRVPGDYMRITSGLGDDPPKALLIVPLIINDEIYGVMEIASFREFEQHEREFVEKVAESIASTISTVKVNIRTNRLLDISKMQSEEMSSQEEELRQNLEELQATQEEMGRRQREAEEKERELRAENETLKARLQDPGYGIQEPGL